MQEQIATCSPFRNLDTQQDLSGPDEYFESYFGLVVVLCLSFCSFTSLSEMEIDITIVIVIQHIAMHLMQRKAEDASLTLDPLWFQNAKR